MLVLKICPFFCKNVHFKNFTYLKIFSTNFHSSTRIVTSFKNPNTILVRYFNDHEINETVQNQLKLLDKIPDNNVIIYRAPMEVYIKITHYFSFCLAFIVPSLTIQAFILSAADIFPMYFGGMPLFRSYYDFLGFHFGFYFILIQLCLVVYRFPMRIYHDNKGTYTAIHRGLLPWTTIKEEFKAGEVKRTSTILPWYNNVLYKTNSRKIILFNDYFHRPADFNNMLGDNAKDIDH